MLSKNLLSEIKRRSELLDSLKPLSPENQSRLDKKFRLEFNFNSNRLEGNTLTYGETELLLIFDQTEGTHDFREYQEMQAHDVALRMVHEEAAENERPLTEQFIRSLNAKLLVKPFWKDAITADGQSTRKEIIPGEYKKTPNSVRLANGEIFDYSAPGDVQNEIAELVRWFNAKSEKEDPVLLASLLHYRFVRIHPFDDGNGRTARLLMNYVFSKNNMPLVVIKSAEKKDYLAALNRADTGDLNAFVEYIGNQLLWSLDLSIKAAQGENIEEDNDLDKELELLKQELEQIPNSFDKEKSYSETLNILNKSIIPLYLELNSTLEKVSELFVKTDYSLILSNKNKHGNLEETIYRKPELSWMPFVDDKIEFISLILSFTALKKSIIQKDIVHFLSVELKDYHYNISGNMFKNVLAQLPYGSYLTNNQVNTIVTTVMRTIIEEIKSATNLKN